MGEKIEVLLVDDKPDVRQLLRSTLEPDGRFEIVGEAADGLEAVSLVESARPHLALMDLAMPNMDGLQAIARIRESYPDTKIIVLSGQSASYMTPQVMGAGADAYFQKGGSPAELIGKIAKLYPDLLPEHLVEEAPATQVDISRPAEPAPAQVPATEGSAVEHEEALWELLNFLIHEMQGSLTVIGGFASTLKTSADSMDRAGIQACVEPIERNARGLSELIRQLADVRALETDRIQLELTETGLGGLLRQSVTDAEAGLDRPPTQVDIADAAMARVDPDRIRQVFAALLSNAAKFSPPTEPVQVTLGRRGAEAEITISDRCGGIHPDQAGRLFGRFTRLEGGPKGTGLGLYLARGIARAHGGDVRYEAAPGGCRFVLSLPVLPGFGSQLSHPVQTGRVLVVDDEPDLARLIEHHLTGQGLEVHLAGDGPTSVEMATRLQPDLILLDVMMQGMDGYAVCEKLREDPRTANAFIIMLTARVHTEDRMMGLTSGADEYLTKPFDPEELVARVKAALRRVREMKALSPLTGLPGNIHIQQRIEQLVSETRPFALLYADLDHFKAYNDRYGFIRGDRAIQRTAETIREVANEVGGPGSFVGHVGGDDFVMLVEPERAEELASALVRRFDAIVPSLYDPDDLRAGSIEVADRRGAPHRYPLLSVSIGVTSSAKRQFAHFGEAVTVANELKQFAKREPGSSYALDRRSG